MLKAQGTGFTPLSHLCECRGLMCWCLPGADIPGAGLRCWSKCMANMIHVGPIMSSMLARSIYVIWVFWRSVTCMSSALRMRVNRTHSDLGAGQIRAMLLSVNSSVNRGDDVSGFCPTSVEYVESRECVAK